MSITELEVNNRIAKGYKEKHGRDISDKDLKATFDLCRMFNLDPYLLSFEEMHQGILEGIKFLGELLDKGLDAG